MAFVFCFATPHSLETFLVLSYVLFGPPRKEEEENERNGRGRTGERAFRFLAAACDGDSQEFPTWWYQYASMRVHVQCRAKNIPTFRELYETVSITGRNAVRPWR